MSSPQTYYVIGLMSGSSLDGLDIAYCKFTFHNTWSFELLQANTLDLGVWQETFRNYQYNSTQSTEHLHQDFAVFLAEKVQEFIALHHIEKVDLVASHGHTLYHFPAQGTTCQVGDGQIISKLLQKTVVSNLRQKDMDAGGQGAPIVPIGDLHLFHDFPICLNLGGIANVSIQQSNKILAFDICVANQVLNYFAQKLKLPYDDEGKIAATGKVNVIVLERLNALPFFQKVSPRSLDNAFQKELIQILEQANLSIPDVLATFCEHIALQLKQALQNFPSMQNPNSKVLITGGGAFNQYLIKRFQAQMPYQFILPEASIIHFKEAVVMGFIGVLRIRNEINVLASVTGAKVDTCCGDLFQA